MSGESANTVAGGTWRTSPRTISAHATVAENRFINNERR